MPEKSIAESDRLLYIEPKLKEKIEKRTKEVASNRSSLRIKGHSNGNLRTKIPSSDDVSSSFSEGTHAVGGVNAEKTLCQCLFSRTFMLYLMWSCVVQVVLSMCLGTFNPWLNYVTDDNTSEVSLFTDVLFYSMLASTVLALGIGVGLDLLKRTHVNADITTINRRILATSSISLGATSVFGIVACSFFMVSSPDSIITTCVILVIFRTALYNCGATFLRIMYPTHYFGLLCGVMSLLAGGISFLQYPLFLWVQRRNQAWMEVFGFLDFLSVLSLASPLYLMYKRQLLRKQKEQAGHDLKICA